MDGLGWTGWEEADKGFRDARELVAELEFVWDQIKHNSASSSGSSPGRGVPSYTTQPHQSGNDGMRLLSPMSQDDEAERESDRRLGYNDAFEENHELKEDGDQDRELRRWRRTIEHALVKMTAEIAALREQIATAREYQGRRRRSLGRWIAWVIWMRGALFAGCSGTGDCAVVVEEKERHEARRFGQGGLEDW